MAPSDFALNSARSDSSNRPAPIRTRSQSISSDRPSLNGIHGLQSPPMMTSPDPVFVAASAASQIITNDHDNLAETWFDQDGVEPSGETALVAPPALKLVNRFLDQLLFNFLSLSRSTSLASLRPAVSEVLKQKLAKEAISGADQELQEYLGGGEDEELLALQNGLERSGEWDLELIWKRTRLRCMVYSSLGDMEEEDEDYYIEQEQLDGPPGSNNRFSNNPGVVSPAVAIFLTSILEFMGEQVLVIAGQAAYHRLRNKQQKDEREGVATPADSSIADRVVVEETDVERVALDRTLGRLWRGWKKRIRSPTTSISMSRSFSRESMSSLRQMSQPATLHTGDDVDEEFQIQSLAEILAEEEYAASIPLPLTSEDIREIEIPGLAYQSDDEEEEPENDGIQIPTRPKSLVFFAPGQDPSSIPSHTNVPRFLSPLSRTRSNSLPTPAPLSFNSQRLGRVATPVEDGDVAQSPADSDNLNDEEEHKGVVAEVVAGAVALGAAAVAGIAAAATGEAPQTSLVKDHDYVEEFTEEPEIMTSSRISIGGRISPEEAVELSRRSSIRTHSVHSLRLIEVASPKSPPPSGSRTPSLARSVSLTRSRPNSIHSPALVDLPAPRSEGTVAKGINASPLARNGSSLSSRQARNSAEESISEVEEREPGDESPPMTAVPSDVAAAMAGVDFYPSPTSQQYTPVAPMGREITPTASKPPTSKPKTFVLSQPPPPRNAGRLNTSSVVPEVARSSSPGALPLAPLRESSEGAPATYDQTKSNHDSHSNSYSTNNTSEFAVNGHSPAISTSSFNNNQQRTPKSQPYGVRGSPQRQSREEITRKEVPKYIRTHTAGSSTSSTSHKIKPIRTSEDNSAGPIEDKSRSFEQLIRSDQTIQYTLTPQNMRNIESPDSPQNGFQHVAANSYDGGRPPTGRSHSSSASKYTAPRPSDISKSSKSPKQAQAQAPYKTVSNTGARLRPNAPQARDARVRSGSIGDFADFIKTTGPSGGQYELPATNTPPNGHRVSNSLGKSGAGVRTAPAAKLPKRSESSAGRARLQARDAVVSRGDSISDLIDFVRSGPQLETNGHRIPRTVAPFRTTMDSDQMAGAVGGKAVDASLPDPRYSQASASVSSSVTSQSALLQSTKRSKPLSPQRTQGFTEEEDLMPVRKTRRVRDMYQIDFSDEEEEYEARSGPSRAKPPPQEESLADFLRNVPPPPDSSPAPLYTEVPDAANKKLRKKSSTSGFMSRFRRDSKDTISGPQTPPKPKSSGQDSRAPGSRSGLPVSSRLPPSRTNSAGQYGSTYKSSGPEPSRGDYVAQVDHARKNDQSRNKVVQKSYQPREAVYTNTRTNDLASFLRDSEPPSAMQAQPRPFAPIGQKDDSTFARMRKKVY